MIIELTPAEEDALLTLLGPIINGDPTEAESSLYDKVYSRHDIVACPKCEIEA